MSEQTGLQAQLTEAIRQKYAPVRVYAALMDVDKQAPGRYVSIPVLVAHVGLPVRQVQAILEALCKEGTAERQIHMGRPTMYRLRFPHRGYNTRLVAWSNQT